MEIVTGFLPARDQVLVVAALVILGQALPLLWRRQAPWTVLALAGATAAVQGFLLYPAAVNPLLLAASLYAVAMYREQRVSRFAAAVTLGAYALSLAVVAMWQREPLLAALCMLLLLLPWVLGVFTRTRRAYLAELEARTALAEQAHEERTEQALREERARIARELHDIVAHHVSSMGVQAEAAREVRDRQPEFVDEALTYIQRTSVSTVMALRRLLGVLRSPRTGDAGDGWLAPQPGVAWIDALVEQFRAAGLPVELHVRGRSMGLPADLDLSVYRILQEALTNVLRHAGRVHTVVTLSYSEREVEVVVRDAGPGVDGARQQSAGHGLVGMRERVALFGGELRVGPSAQRGWMVLARLPVGGPLG